jgi:hypothetical protein
MEAWSERFCERVFRVGELSSWRKHSMKLLLS